MKHYFGQRLVDAGVISVEQLEQALEIQQQKPYLRVGEILFSLGAISFPNLDRELKDFHADIRIGQMLIYRGLITTKDLERALNTQEARGGYLGEILVQQGSCTQHQIDRTLDAQKRFRKNFEALIRGRSL